MPAARVQGCRHSRRPASRCCAGGSRAFLRLACCAHLRPQSGRRPLARMAPASAAVAQQQSAAAAAAAAVRREQRPPHGGIAGKPPAGMRATPLAVPLGGTGAAGGGLRCSQVWGNGRLHSPHAGPALPCVQRMHASACTMHASVCSLTWVLGQRRAPQHVVVAAARPAASALAAA